MTSGPALRDMLPAIFRMVRRFARKAISDVGGKVSVPGVLSVAGLFLLSGT